MKDFWIKFACFLTGHNYELVKSSSEATTKSVKKYFSAMLIITTLWAFIGYSFTQRYLHGNTITSVLGAIIMVVMVIQIERQIILTIEKKTSAFVFRVLIGIIMAVIGSVILDQVIFKDDIEKFKLNKLQIEVNKLMPIKTQELSKQIQDLDNAILSLETQRADLNTEVSLNPTIPIPSSTTQYERDSTGKLISTTKISSSASIPNPKADLIPQIDSQIKILREQKSKKENEKLNVQSLLEKELQSKVGFLDELKNLFEILFSSKIAFMVWILLFLFFLSIEFFILISKSGENQNDYDKTIIHQMEIRKKMLDEIIRNRYQS